ncbi:MAG: lysophospholipase [Blastopirellula sp.]|nr:lysophospholipase [Blastopirellula sp.]
MPAPSTSAETIEYVQLNGTRTCVRMWTPTGNVSAAITLVHGLSEHSGRYQPVVQQLLKAGFAVLAFDLPGHGLTEGRRGHVPAYAQLMDRVGWLVQESQTRFPQQPQVLFGHSWGGSLVLNYVLRKRPNLAALVASAPALRLAYRPPVAKLLLGRLMYRLWPSLTMAKDVDTNLLTRSQEVRDAFKADSLNHERISSRLAIDLLDTGKWAREHAAELTTPTLILHGDADQITCSQASCEFAEQAGDHCQIKIFPGLYHEPHHEPEAEEVLGYLITWLQTKLPSPRATDSIASS